MWTLSLTFSGFQSFWLCFTDLFLWFCGWTFHDQGKHHGRSATVQDQPCGPQWREPFLPTATTWRPQWAEPQLWEYSHRGWNGCPSGITHFPPLPSRYSGWSRFACWLQKPWPSGYLEAGRVGRPCRAWKPCPATWQPDQLKHDVGGTGPG